MSEHIKDRWLWLGLGITLILTAFIGQTVSNEAQLEQEIPREDQTRKEKKSAVEALSVSTLRTLVDSPNPNISQMAIDLVLKRLRNYQVNAEVVRLIKLDMKSTDEQLKQKASTALALLHSERDIPSVFSPTWSEASSSSPHMDDQAWLEVDSDLIPTRQTPVAGWTAIPRERPQVSDTEVRRRRREAVVLLEGTGEVDENDIIRPADLHFDAWD